MNHLTYDDNQREMFMFQSMTEVIGFCNADKYQQKVYTGRTKGKFIGRSDVPTWNDLARVTNDNWLEGLKTLQQFVRDLMKEDIPLIKSKKRKVEYSAEDGDEVDYDKMMSGQAEFFRSSVREDKDGETATTIIIDTTTPYHQQSLDILWRGAAAIALAMILEDKGYVSEIWCVNGSRLWAGKFTAVMTSCCLKRTSDPLDFSTLVNTVSGWFYRSATFTLLETLCDYTNNRPADGYGSCYYPSDLDLDNFSRDKIRVYSSGVCSYSGALDLIRSQLNSIVKRVSSRN